jgi:hypothetical protein
MVQIASRVMIASSNTTEQLTKLLFPELAVARINDTFSKPEHGTNMIEKNVEKLNGMYKLGIGSYAEHEREVQAIFNI